MGILGIVFDRLVFFVLGFVICVGIICGGVIGMITGSAEMRSWLNSDDAEDILSTWMSIKHVARFIPGYAIGHMMGTKLGKILDETADL